MKPDSVSDLLQIDVVIAFDSWHFKEYGYVEHETSSYGLGLAAFKGAYETVGGFNEAVAQLTAHIEKLEASSAVLDDEVLLGFFVGQSDSPFYRSGNKLVPRFGADYKASLLACARKLIGKFK